MCQFILSTELRESLACAENEDLLDIMSAHVFILFYNLCLRIIDPNVLP